jgi:TM2 domain-containing membrane protein YozV
MEQNKIDMFVASMGSKFPETKLMEIREKLSKLDDSKLSVIQSIQYKDPTTVLILSLFLGNFGVDRFTFGETGLGIAKILTCGGFGVWSLIDLFTAMGRARTFNFKKFSEVAI